MNASTKRHNNDSIELEFKTDTKSMWILHAFNSEAKKVFSVLAGNDNPL